MSQQGFIHLRETKYRVKVRIRNTKGSDRVRDACRIRACDTMRVGVSVSLGARVKARAKARIIGPGFGLGVGLWVCFGGRTRIG